MLPSPRCSEPFRTTSPRTLAPTKLESLRQAQLKMIRSYDAKNGVVRGLGGKSVKVAAAKDGEERPKMLPPRYWAAFQFSGDWR